MQARVALCDQLRAELERFWPGPIGLFKDLDSPISLAFLARYPSPRDARTLGVKRLEAFLSRQRYSGHKPVSELLAKLRSAPEGCAGETEMTARRAVVLGLVATLTPLVAQIRHDPQLVGAPPRPRRHPADARRRRHPTRRAAGPSATRLTASRQPLPALGRLTQDVFTAAAVRAGWQ